MNEEEKAKEEASKAYEEEDLHGCSYCEKLKLLTLFFFFFSPGFFVFVFWVSVLKRKLAYPVRP